MIKFTIFFFFRFLTLVTVRVGILSSRRQTRCHDTYIGSLTKPCFFLYSRNGHGQCKVTEVKGPTYIDTQTPSPFRSPSVLDRR